MKIYSQSGSLLGIFSLMNANSADYSLASAVRNRDCNGALISIDRTYRTNPLQEVYSLYSATTHLIFLQDVPLGLQIQEGQSSQTVCLPPDDYVLEVGDDHSNYWECGSFAEVMLHAHPQHRVPLLRARYDSLAGTSPLFRFSTQFLLFPGSVWEFHLSTLPSNWWFFPFSDKWEQDAVDHYPPSPNQFQFYRHVFTISPTSDLPSSITLSIRFLCGCVVVINNREVYRRHLPPHALLNSTLATGCYERPLFRSIAIATRTVTAHGKLSNLLQHGKNAIVVSLVGNIPDTTHSVFDAFLLPQFNHSLLFHFSLTSTGFRKDVHHLFDSCSSTFAICKDCRNASITIVFDDDRRELASYAFFSRVMLSFSGLSEMVIEAKNPEDAEWTELAAFQDLLWYESINQKWRYFWKTRAWNQIRFSRMRAELQWVLTVLDVQYRIIDPADSFSYPQNLVVFTKTTPSFIYPSSLQFSSFTATGDTSAFLLDSLTGGVLPLTASSPQTASITITALSVLGIPFSFTLFTTLADCQANYAYARLCVRPDSTDTSLAIRLANDPSQTVFSWSFFDTAIRTRACSLLCLPQEALLLSLRSDNPHGWKEGHGFVFLPPNAPFPLASGTVSSPDHAPFELSVKYVLASDTPCWVWNKAEAPNPRWKEFDLDDHDWRYTAASAITPFSRVTQYFRYPLQSVDYDEHVYQCTVTYTGGVAVYVNGRAVAVFNLPLPFGHETLAKPNSRKPLTAAFIILMEQYYSETTILAAELHRAEGAEAASALFSLECVASFASQSAVVSSLDSVSAPADFEAEKLMDYDVTTSATVHHRRDYVYAMEAANARGIAFNALLLIAHTDMLFSSFSVFGGFGDTINPIASFHNLSVSATRPNFLPVPAGLLSFTTYSVHFTLHSSSSPSSSTTLSEILPVYTHYVGAPCAGVDGFPRVREGQISPGFCPDGMSGYSFRVCRNGEFTPVDVSHCVLQAPAHLGYSNTTFFLREAVAFHSSPPSHVGIVTQFSVEGKLPEGLLIDPVAGVLYGVPQNTGVHNITVVGSNSAGSARVSIRMIINPTLCVERDGLPQAVLGSKIKVGCDGRIGILVFQCVIWQNAAAWVKESGTCVSYSTVSYVAVLFVGIVFYCVYQAVHAIRVANRKRRIRHLSVRLYNQTMKIHYVE